MKNYLKTILVFFITSISYSQYNSEGCLTIFSEEGDKFFLTLNGELMNDIPQTNIRVEDLDQPFYQVRIEFENENLIEINKDNINVIDVDDNYIDVTYRIRRDKNNSNKMKFNYFSESPKSEVYIPKENVHVIHFDDIIIKKSTIETTTITTVTDNIGVGANISVDGFNMNVSIYDRQPVVISQTTITNNTHGFDDFGSYRDSCDQKYEMKSSDFNAAVSSVKNQNFEETKLTTAKQISSANCLSVNQIIEIAKVFNFEDSKLSFAKFAYANCIDKKKYFLVNDIFSFSVNIEELSNYIQGKK
ncbi:DUF4476 domain-containing protein [Aequorivita antarctica]|nr:DUF4476 domain-containing protein [Aequorivita antarctica]